MYSRLALPCDKSSLCLWGVNESLCPNMMTQKLLVAVHVLLTCFSPVPHLWAPPRASSAMQLPCVIGEVGGDDATAAGQVTKPADVVLVRWSDGL